MDNRIGTCGLCGGPVVILAYAVNPTAHCARCGAIPAEQRGPVIPMRQPVYPNLDDWQRPGIG